MPGVTMPDATGGVCPLANVVTAFRFVRTVLISPLWQASRNGWASFQSGNVLVEYRRWK